jgi:DNA-binding NarL/FixJ family response regulator
MKDKDFGPIKILIVSDNHIFRSGLWKILEAQVGILVLGDSSMERAEAVNGLLRRQPELILLDLDSRTTDALAAVESIQKTFNNSSMLVLTDLADHELIRRALSLGVAGVVLKMQPPAVLIAAIQHLCARYRFEVMPTPSATEQSGSQPSSTPAPNAQERLRIDSLTPRERDIIRLVGLGLKNKDIANRLSISDITVRHHLTSIFCKLEITDRQKLLILAHRYGLADLSLHAESA